jgi:hypothetical protein
MKPGQFGKLGNKVALGFIALGLLFILLGYNGAAGNLDVRAQLPYIVSGGLVGVSLVIFGAALMVTQSAREDRRRIEGLLQQLVDAQPSGGYDSVPSDADGLFAAGTASFHKPGCRLVDGREEIAYVTASEAASRDLKPCRVCQPEVAGTNVTIR